MTINEKIGVCFKVHLILFCDSWLVYPSTSSQSVPYAVPHDCTQICEDCEPSVLGTARWQDKSQVWRRTEIGGFVLSNQVSRNLLISQMINNRSCHHLFPAFLLVCKLKWWRCWELNPSLVSPQSNPKHPRKCFCEPLSLLMSYRIDFYNS